MWLQGARRKVVEFFTKTCTCPLLWESDTMRSASVADLLRELAQERALRESAETAMEQAQVERDELRAQWDRNTVGLIRERDEARAECERWSQGRKPFTEVEKPSCDAPERVWCVEDVDSSWGIGSWYLYKQSLARGQAEYTRSDVAEANAQKRERAALSAAANRATDWYLSGSHGSEEDLRRAVLGGIGEAVGVYHAGDGANAAPADTDAVVARIVDQRDAWLQCCCGECSVLAAAADRAVVAFEEAMRDDMDDTYSKAHIRDAVMGPS